MDPGNQIYAAWLCTIAGVQRDKINSNHRERIGDMVENALGICRIIDEYLRDLGFLLGDPNGMWSHMEESIRLFIEGDYAQHFTFGKYKLQKPKYRKLLGTYCHAVLKKHDSMHLSVIVTEDVVGSYQHKSSFQQTERSQKLKHQKHQSALTAKTMMKFVH